jgi:hypothetical protein
LQAGFFERMNCARLCIWHEGGHLLLLLLPLTLSGRKLTPSRNYIVIAQVAVCTRSITGNFMIWDGAVGSVSLRLVATSDEILKFPIFHIIPGGQAKDVEENIGKRHKYQDTNGHHNTDRSLCCRGQVVLKPIHNGAICC